MCLFDTRHCRVERFSEEMNQLLEITLRSRLVEKLCVAMYSGIFEEHAEDDEQEVRAPGLTVFCLGSYLCDCVCDCV